MEINSHNIRSTLMYYYRFKRQFIICSEVRTDNWELADLLIDTGTKFIEIEIKCSKYDLIKGEANKEKHSKSNDKRLVNEFYICIPTELLEEAKKWVEQTNKKYGIIEFKTEIAKHHTYRHYYIFNIIQKAKYLQTEYKKDLKDKLTKRLSSALTTEYLKKVK